jgi:hypothetical protein
MRSAKVLGDIVNSAIGAKTHFDMWWAQASEGRSEIARVRNAHSDFFLATRDAHYVAFFVYFGQLFDKRADASSIKNYLKSVKQATEPVLLSTYEAQHDLLMSRAKPLLSVRHLRVAHKNAQLTESDVFAPLKITWFQIRDIIYDSADFVAKLTGAKHCGEVGIPLAGRLEEATNALYIALGADCKDVLCKVDSNRYDCHDFPFQKNK